MTEYIFWPFLTPLFFSIVSVNSNTLCIIIKFIHKLALAAMFCLCTVPLMSCL